MTELAPGWYPDPDDSMARRYWDGATWSGPLSAFEPVTAPSSLPPAATPAPTCAVGPCLNPRAPGSQFCAAHGRKGQLTSIPAGRSPSPSSSGQAALICPHCGSRGTVASKAVKKKRGISGGKATGAVLTAGVSLFATGLSRKEKVTERHCSNCGTTWDV